MKKSAVWTMGLLLVVSMLLAACGGGGGSEATEAPAVDRPAPPAEYAGKTNPHAGDSAAAEAGKTAYTTNCESCHGATGAGDGPAAASLNPKPQNLAEVNGSLGEDYMFWRISEGGAMAPFNSAMPAWKGVLTEDQIWQVITYVKTLGQ